MAHCRQLTMMFIAFLIVILGVSTSTASVYFTDGDEGNLGLAEYGKDLGNKADETEVIKGADEEAVVPAWMEPQIHAGLNDLKHSLQSRYQTASKRSWLPGTQTGLFGKRGGHWSNAQDLMEKRQLWANQQSGLFGKRENGEDQPFARWTVKRSAEEGSYGRERRRGGVPHIFKSGGIFGKRSADNWATRFE